MMKTIESSQREPIYKSITKKELEPIHMERKYVKNVAYFSFNYFSKS